MPKKHNKRYDYETEKVVVKYPDGGTSEEYYVLKDNPKIKHGKYCAYHPNGKNAGETTFVNNEIHGKFCVWYDNGQLKEKVNYNYGSYEGKSYSWYKSGQLSGECNSTLGLLNGENVLYYEDGTIKDKTEYKYGLTVKEVKYDKEGNIISFKDIPNSTLHTGKLMSYFKKKFSTGPRIKRIAEDCLESFNSFRKNNKFFEKKEALKHVLNDWNNNRRIFTKREIAKHINEKSIKKLGDLVYFIVDREDLKLMEPEHLNDTVSVLYDFFLKNAPEENG